MERPQSDYGLHLRLQCETLRKECEMEIWRCDLCGMTFDAPIFSLHGIDRCPFCGSDYVDIIDDEEENNNDD